MELLNVHEAELKSEIVNNEDATMKPKLRRLDQINKILAHRPWAIKKHHIKVLKSIENIIHYYQIKFNTYYVTI